MKIYHLTEDIKALETEDLDRLLKTDFSDAYENATNGYFIYKGMYIELDPNKAHHLEPIKNRPSQNTLNFYTLWVNNSPAWSEYPKRNVICSTSERNASDYGLRTYAILPRNGSKIGVCSDFDMWESFDLGGGMANADDANRFFKYIFEDYYKKIPSTYKELVNMLQNIEVDEKYIHGHLDQIMSRHGLNKSTLIPVVEEKGMFGLFTRMFSTKGFQISSVDDLSKYSGEAREVWFDNDFIAIDHENIGNIIK